MHPAFYVPNIIDYMRIVTLLAGIAFSNKYSLISVILFALSDVLDAFDGNFARMFN